MSSDEAYSSFLDQANQETGASKASTQSGIGSTKVIDTDVPGALRSIEHYYTSDADEPFEPVSLRWTGQNMPSENEFKDLIGHTDEISTLSTKEFDPKGQYKEVLAAVEKVGDGMVRVFRAHHGKTRAEYYVVGFDKEGRRIVGMKAKAVES
ncbi:MAG: hypothetical protein Q9187_004559 [Circinaria calcarea]